MQATTQSGETHMRKQARTYLKVHDAVFVQPVVVVTKSVEHAVRLSRVQVVGGAYCMSTIVKHTQSLDYCNKKVHKVISSGLLAAV